MAASAIAKGVSQAAKVIARVVVTVVETPISAAISKTFGIQIGPSNLVSSPWGSAYQLYHKAGASDSGAASGDVTIYCVNCGVSGSVSIGGSASLNIIHGLTAAQVGVTGNIAAGLQLGLDTNAQISQISQTFRTQIASTGLPGFSVPGIFIIGPIITLEAEMDLSVTAQGLLLVGATMSIPNFSAHLDLVNNKNTLSTGFTPQFQKVFNASGQISASAAIGLPLSIGIGIEAPLIKFKKVVALTNTPSVAVSAVYRASSSNRAACNNGIAYSLASSSSASVS